MVDARPKRASLPPRPKKDDGGYIWSILGGISLVAAILVFVGGTLPSWRVSEPFAWHFMSRSTAVSERVQATQYGLYTVSYNGGAVVKNWSLLQSQICTGIDALAPVSQGLDILTDVGCGSICIGHFRTRCQVYTRLQFWGYVVLGSLIVVGCLGIAAAGWIFMFGPNRVILQILWTGGSLVSLAAVGFWIMTSNDGFVALQSNAHFPYPSLSTAIWVTLSGLFLLLACGLIALLSAYISDRAEWRAKQEAIQNKILQEAGLGQDPFSLPSGALGGVGLAQYQYQAPGGGRGGGLPPFPPPGAQAGRGQPPGRFLPLPLPPGGWPPGHPAGMGGPAGRQPGGGQVPFPPPPSHAFPPPGHPAAARRSRY